MPSRVKGYWRWGSISFFHIIAEMKQKSPINKFMAGVVNVVSEKEKDIGIVQDMAANRLMSVKEAEKRLHVSHGFFARLLKTGIIPFIQIESRKKVSVFAINDFIRKYEQESNNLMADLERREMKISARKSEAELDVNISHVVDLSKAKSLAGRI